MWQKFYYRNKGWERFWHTHYKGRAEYSIEYNVSCRFITYYLYCYELFLRYPLYRRAVQKKSSYDLDSHGGVVIHLEPDILDCKVKWTLGSITTKRARGGNEISTEIFKILKDDAVKVLHSICWQIWKTQQRPQN